MPCRKRKVFIHTSTPWCLYSILWRLRLAGFWWWPALTASLSSTAEEINPIKTKSSSSFVKTLHWAHSSMKCSSGNCLLQGFPWSLLQPQVFSHIQCWWYFLRLQAITLWSGMACHWWCQRLLGWCGRSIINRITWHCSCNGIVTVFKQACV